MQRPLQKCLFTWRCFLFFFCDLNPRFFPPFSFSLFYVLCIFIAWLFGSCLYDLGRVILTRRCGKMNFLEAIFFFLLCLGGFYCASCMYWLSDMYNTYSLYIVVFKCAKLLDVLTFTVQKAFGSNYAWIRTLLPSKGYTRVGVWDIHFSKENILLL